MKVLITGANGMVARATVRHCLSRSDDVYALKRRELDIGDREAVLRIFESIRPEVVLNCAAYTDVDGAETHSDLCYAANSVGPENLAEASREFDSAFVTVSTDYVFDGDKAGFYFEDDLPNPQSVYAKSKLEGEVRAAEANPDSIIVRSGWIYGEHGTNFLSVMPKLLADGKNTKAISDSFGTPTFAADLAARMREIAGSGAKGIFHITNDGPGTSYLEFAEAIAEICRHDTKLIEAVSKDSLKRPAPRPANSRLASNRKDVFGLPTMREWRSALREFLSMPAK